MHKQVKKYFSLFFLFLLLFPIAEKAVHAFEHEKDIHCTATEKHFHEQEHSCSICDFTLIDSNSLPKSDVTFYTASTGYLFQPFHQSINIPYPFSNLPSRAPPIA